MSPDDRFATPPPPPDGFVRIEATGPPPTPPSPAPLTPPPTPPPSLVYRPATRRTVLAVATGAVAADLTLWSQGPGIAWAIGTTLVSVALVAGARPTRRSATVLLGLAPVFGVLCALRASPWLVVPNVLAATVCVLAAATSASRGRPHDLSLPRLTVRIVSLVAEAATAPAWIARAWIARGWMARGVRGRAAPGGAATAGRSELAQRAIGLALAVPLVLVLGALFASADPVFASFFDVGLAPGSIARHLCFAGLGAAALLTLLRAAAATSDAHLGTVTTQSATIGNVVLGGVTAVFGVYSVSRLLALTGTARHIAETRGLTWADHARSGFFQLLAVATITLAVLLTVRGWSASRDDGQRRVQQRLALVDVALVIGIVVDAVARLSGYERAYGLTMLRLYSTGFAVWIALVFVVVGVSFLRPYDGAKWLTPAIGATALAAVLAMNLVNPESLVARRNLTGPTRLGETDLPYLLDELGSDARPTIDRHLGSLSPADLGEVGRNGCASSPSERWLDLNLADRTAAAVERRWCERFGGA